MSKDTEDTAALPPPSGPPATPSSGPPGAPSPAASSGARGPESASADRDRVASEGERERPRSSRPKVSGPATGPHSEPEKMLDLAELPETYGVDEVEILCKDPWWYFVYWEVTEKSLEAARRELSEGSATEAGDESKLVLRLFVTPPTAAPSGRGRDSGREIRDVPLSSRHGRRYLEAAKPNSHLRAAVGLLTGEGLFLPIAHSSLLRVPPQQPSSETSIEWLHVLPGRGDGQHRERIQRGDRGSGHKERALSWRGAWEAPGASPEPRDGTLIVDGPSGPSSSSTPRPGSGSGGIG